jgi:ATP-dependent Clp protease ATP-binding subunit ClpX
MILVGPSGTGKTATVTEYCKLLNLPYVIADMTAYTQAGYVGGNIEDIFIRLINEAGGMKNIELAQKGIIIMDEGDKNESKASSGDIDVGGKGVIDSLLKKIEGADIDLGKGRVFNSTNTTFITMGVYPRLYDIRKERMVGKKSIGFSTNYEAVKDYGEFIADDFINHGFSQEYVGRFSNIVELKPLTDEAYLDILRNGKDSAYKQYKALFDYSFGIELIITPEGELSIVEQTKKYNIGARGLQRCMAKILENIEKRIMLEDFQCEKIVIDKDCEVKII